MVCPPEVGQPGGKTCLAYFREFFPKGLAEVTNDEFKKMVYNHIVDIMPIYVEHLFDSDWLLWIYLEKSKFTFRAISQSDIKNYKWEKENAERTLKNLIESREKSQSHTHFLCPTNLVFRTNSLLSLSFLSHSLISVSAEQVANIEFSGDNTHLVI